MKRLALAIAAFLVTTATSAQIYQWKDESGKTVISDKPPAGSASTVKKVGSAPSSSNPSAQKSTTDRDMEMRKRQQETQENLEKTAKDQAAAAGKAKNCESARRYLQTLESGERIALRDDKGERYFMEDTQREQETASTRQLIESNCGN